ncbi:MAG: hypothetical protein KDB21_02790 [Acidimicrobiales bacterium]|nr:hypothetical protein [Acidimicrobiales bacterium]
MALPLQDQPADGTVLEDLPADVVEQLPSDIVSQLREGAIDAIPEDVVESLPASVQARIPDSVIAAAGDDPALAVILAVVGALAVLGFLWGVFKSAFKAALFFAVVGAGAWIWFAQQAGS